MKNPTVVMKTSMGVTIEPFADQAPASVKDFLAYGRTFYDGTIFPRVSRTS
jgi:cyclophilin family peptidyl-prolyl cis-trans isomerase